MTNRTVQSAAVALALAALGAGSAAAQITYDTAPNDTFATATPTVAPAPGQGGISIVGGLTVGDIDTYSFYYTAPSTPDPSGAAPGFTFQDTWSAGSSTGNNFVNWLNERDFTGGGRFFAGTGVASTWLSTTTYTSLALPSGLYFLQICSSNPSPVSTDPATPPSTVAGTYTITNFHGINGGTISPTAAPEPSQAAALALGALGLAGLVARGRRRAAESGRPG